MKKFMALLVGLTFFSNVCFADCDFSLGIKPLADGGYEYTKQCHEQVGVMKGQIMDLRKAVDLENDAILKADQRADMWMNTSLKLEDQFQKVDSLQKSNERLYFGLGALTVILTAIAMASATHRN